jgi:hypothetical protein
MLTEALRGGAGAAGRMASLRRTMTLRTAASRMAAALGAGAFALAALAGGTSARAQAIAPGDQRDFSIKAGIYIPSQSQVRSASSAAIPMFEGDYMIQKFPESHFNSLLSVGYLEHARFRMIPITVSQIYRDPNNASGVNYYYGVGVGIYETRLGLVDTSNRTKGLFGGFIVTGLDLTKTVFAEAKYHLISHYDNKNVGGFQLSAGLRF